MADFNQQPPARQALTILALADLANPRAAPLVAKTAESATGEVRVQALGVLPVFKIRGAARVLVASSLDSDPRVAQTARASLARLAGADVDPLIIALLEDRDTQRRRLGIDLSARRSIAAATPDLLTLSESAQREERLAAIAALGATVTLDDLPKLLQKATAAASPADLAAAREASRAACVRMPQDKCAAILAGRLGDDGADVDAFLLDQLGIVGGTLALETVVSAARSKNDSQQDAATRVLGEWLSADAAPAMFELARTLPNRKYQIRALRGYIRIARQLDMPTAARMEVCRNALRIADRNDEKTLVLEVLRRHAAGTGLAIAASLLSDADLREPACNAMLAIADKVVLTSPDDVTKPLEQVVQATRRQETRDRATALIAQALQKLSTN